jgi:hypothetical protein
MKRAVKPKDDPALLARVAEFRKLYRVYKVAEVDPMAGTTGLVS